MIFIISGDGASTEAGWNDKEVVAIDENENAPDARQISLHFQLARSESYLAGKNFNCFNFYVFRFLYTYIGLSLSHK